VQNIETIDSNDLATVPLEREKSKGRSWAVAPSRTGQRTQKTLMETTLYTLYVWLIKKTT
jgi:hypothetical protein